jgi:haloacetate dehalogenase
VVITDLRGYGLSDKPPGQADHANYSKRTMAQDQVQAMRQLGFPSVFLCGHDRGAQVSHRWRWTTRGGEEADAAGYFAHAHDV